MSLYQWWCHLPMHLAMAWAIGFMLVVVWMIAWLIKRADPLEQEKRAIRKKRKVRRRALNQLRIYDKTPACWRDFKGIHK